MRYIFGISILLILATVCHSHMSPPVQLVGEQEALRTLIPPSLKSNARHIRLNSAQKEEVHKKSGWKPSEKTIRYFIGTDDQGVVRSTVFVVSEYTLHGSIRVAVACDSEGRLTGAELLEVSEEAYNWVKPLIDQNYMKQVVHSSSAEHSNTGTMTNYYAEEIAKLVQHVPSLCAVVRS